MTWADLTSTNWLIGIIGGLGFTAFLIRRVLRSTPDGQRDNS